jgi:hypothetical protein
MSMEWFKLILYVELGCQRTCQGEIVYIFLPKAGGLFMLVPLGVPQTFPAKPNYAVTLSRPHMRCNADINFDLQNRAFFITSITSSPLAGLAVNGETVSRQMNTLNQHSMKVWVDSLEYIFQYTDFASSEGFKEKREEYLTTTLRARCLSCFHCQSLVHCQ